MTTLYIDCEFNGFQGKLISLALYNPDGDGFYEVAQIPHTSHPWVEEHVLPVLNQPAVGYEETRRALHAYLWDLPRPIRIIADWPEDILHLCRLLAMDGGRQLKIELTFELIQTGEFSTAEASDVPHNAWHDAKALGDWHQHLRMVPTTAGRSERPLRVDLGPT